MKNITVTIDDETYRLSRVKAAEAGTTVTGMVRAYLAALSQCESLEAMSERERFERLRRLQEVTIAEIFARGGGLRAADNLPREALYDRDALR